MDFLRRIIAPVGGMGGVIKADIWLEASREESCEFQWFWSERLRHCAKEWERPFWEGVWPCLDPWDCVRLRTGSTQWNFSGKYVPHGELFFFLIQKESVVKSNEVLPLHLCGNAQGVRADWFAPCGSGS